MGRRIIIDSDVQVGCPKCRYEFPLQAGISTQTIDRYADDFDSALSEQRKQLEAEARKLAEKESATRVDAVKAELAEAQRLAKEVHKSIEKVRIDAKRAAREEQETELRSARDDAAARGQALEKAREGELELRGKLREAEETTKNSELEYQRKLDAERITIGERERTAAKADADRQIAQVNEQLAQARREADDMKRKLEQGSQQVQGEALEASLETLLRTSFPFDEIDDVPKGMTGADLIQRVRSPSGQVCGTIVWEAKQTKNWQQGWLTKLKDDQRAVGAEIAVLVTAVMPKDVRDTFTRQEDIWITQFASVRPVAEALRTTLVEVHKQRQANVGRNEKMELLYNYVCSPQFAQKLKAIVEGFAAMQSDLSAEKRAMIKHWSRREKQIARLTAGTVSIVGDLQGIGEDSLPQLDSIAALPDPDDELADL
jgi:hypothetical protein